MRRLRMLVTVPVLVLLLTASGSPAAARSAASTGVFLGGFTSQEFPVALQMSKRRVVRIGMGIRLTCTSGGAFSAPDSYRDLKVSKKGRFGSAFADTMRNSDGTTTDFAGTLTGTINKARTKAKGTWSLKATDHDLAGAVTDTCDSGTISWSAKQ
jgi:hypothetical protein